MRSLALHNVYLSLSAPPSNSLTTSETLKRKRDRYGNSTAIADSFITWCIKHGNESA